MKKYDEVRDEMLKNPKVKKEYDKITKYTENFTPDSNDMEFYTDKLSVANLKIKEIAKEVESLKEEMYEKEKELKFSLLGLFILIAINLIFCIFR